MKKLLLLTLLLSIGLITNAQDTKSSDEALKKEIEMNCYLKWAKKFEERKAADVEDGTYDDVIISMRNGSNADCYNGKADVKGGKVTALYLRMEDGVYELVKKKWKENSFKDIYIINGMSKTLITVDDELINVLFVKKILAKKKGYEKAPEPKDD